MPQVYYTYTQHGQRICDSILRYEHLTEDFNSFAAQYELGIELPPKTNIKKHISDPREDLSESLESAPPRAQGKWFYNILVWLGGVFYNTFTREELRYDGVNRSPDRCPDITFPRMLTQDALDRVNDMYQEDFQAFGYKIMRLGKEYWDEVCMY